MIDGLRTDLAVWRRVRAIAPTPVEIAAAGEARAAGDWRAAAAAARADVDIDLDVVNTEFGADATARLVDDLRHLSLDLLRWHLPRHRGGLTTLRSRLNAVLAPPTGADTAPLIRVEPPIAPAGPQRLRVTVIAAGELTNLSWFFAPRHTWDVRAAPRLRERWGGSPDRLPLLTADGRPQPAASVGVGDDTAAATERVYRRLAAGDIAGAWRDCGIRLSLDPADDSDGRRPSRNGPPDGPAGMPACPVGMLATAREAALAFDTDVVHTCHATYLKIGLGESPSADRVQHGDYADIAARVAVDRVPADLALLHTGQLSIGDLHPLVASALFPDRPCATDSDRRAEPPAAGLGGSSSDAVARVRCRGVWHTVDISAGALRLSDHTEAELRREQTVAALGGIPAGCFGVHADWLAGATRLPRALREHRREVRRRALDGDTDWVLDGIARGTLDPRLRDANGWTFMHTAMWMDFDRLLPVLVAHELPIDASDRIGRTPLYLTVMFGGHPRLVRWFLAAGADVTASTVHGADVLTAVYRSMRTDLAFLRERTR